MKHWHTLPVIAAVLIAGGCEVNVEDGTDTSGSANQASAAPAPPPMTPAQRAEAGRIAQAKSAGRQELQDLRLVVDISERNVQVMNGDGVLATHDVAVGTEEWPTPTGDYAFHRVDLNPEWVPPKEEKWAEDETTKAPGDPENPMGRARLVYRMPNTIHGTDDLASLGKASSHGSIRVANEVVLQLAQMLLKAGGAWEGDQWFQQMAQNRTEEFQIPLEQNIPIKVQE